MKKIYLFGASLFLLLTTGSAKDINYNNYTIIQLWSQASVLCNDAENAIILEQREKALELYKKAVVILEATKRKKGKKNLTVINNKLAYCYNKIAELTKKGLVEKGIIKPKKVSIQELKQQVKELKKHNDELQQNQFQLLAKLEAMRRETQRSKLTEKKFAALIKENQSLKAELSLLKNKMATTPHKNENEQLLKLQEKFDALQKDHKTLQTLVTTLTDKKNKALREMTQLKYKYTLLEKKYNTLHSKRNRKPLQPNKETPKAIELTSKIKGLKEIIEDLKKKYNTLNNELTTLRKNVKLPAVTQQIANESQRVKKENQDLAMRNVNLESQLKRITEQQRKLTKNYQGLSTLLAQVTPERDQLQKDIQKLFKQYQSLKEKKLKQDSELLNLKNENLQLKDELKALSKKYEELKLITEAPQKKQSKNAPTMSPSVVAQKDKQIAILKQLNSSFMKEKQVMVQKLKTLEERLAAMSQKIIPLQKENLALKNREMAVQESQRNAAKKRVDAVNRLLKTNKTLQQKNKKLELTQKELLAKNNILFQENKQLKLAKNISATPKRNEQDKKILELEREIQRLKTMQNNSPKNAKSSDNSLLIKRKNEAITKLIKQVEAYKKEQEYLLKKLENKQLEVNKLNKLLAPKK